MLKTIKKIISISEISKQIIVLNILGSFILSSLEILGIGSIFPFLNLILKNNNNSFFNFSTEKDNLLFILILIFIIFFIKNTFIFFFNVYQKKLSVNIQKFLVNKVYRNYLYYDFNKKVELSEILRDINYSTNIGQWFLTVLQLFNEFIILIIIIFFLLFINFKATIIIFAFCTIYYFFFHTLFKSRIQKWSSQNVLTNNQFYNVQLETFNGLREITLMGKQFFFENKFINSLKELISRSLKISIIEMIPKLSLEIIFVFVFVFLTGYLYFANYSFEQIVPLLAVYFVSSLRIFPGYSKIIMLTNNLRYINSQVDVLKKINFKVTNFESDKNLLNKINEIKFINISFKYLNSNDFILKNCNYTFKKNHFYILHGPSGSGKTSVINLLMGLLKPNEGKIVVGEYELNSCINSYRNKIGLVSQDVFIRNANIYENVALGSNIENINYSKVRECIKLSGLEVFVSSKKENLDYILDSNGKNISSGQRQRIGIARALYYDPSIIILDEPTSSLDNDTAENFINTLKKISHNKIVLMITHNPKFFDVADTLITIKDSRLLQTK